jgi:hypothetical protein
VAQDSILTATKLTAAQLITFAVREYLPAMPLTPQTFINRVLTVSGRKELHHDREVIVLYENYRDPLVTTALRDACDRITRRALRRDGRLLQFLVEPPPPKRARFE